MNDPPYIINYKTLDFSWLCLYMGDVARGGGYIEVTWEGTGHCTEKNSRPSTTPSPLPALKEKYNRLEAYSESHI